MATLQKKNNAPSTCLLPTLYKKMCPSAVVHGAFEVTETFFMKDKKLSSPELMIYHLY